MKKGSRFLLPACIMAIPIAMSAQNVRPHIVQKYPAAIVVRVFEFNQKLHLNAEKQEKLAGYFQKEDSTLSTMIVSGKSATEIAATKAVLTAELQTITGAIHVNAMATDDFVKLESSIMANQFQEKYKVDAATTRSYSIAYYNWRKALNNASLQEPDAALLKTKLLKASTQYSTVLDNLTDMAASTSFINQKIEMLDAVKPMAGNVKRNLQNAFYALCVQSKNNSYSDNFNKALHKIVTDTAYYAAVYKDEIKQLATSGTRKYMVGLKKKGGFLKGTAGNRIEEMVYSKEREVAVINYTYPLYTKTKDSCINAINNKYDSLINMACLQNGGTSLASSQFTTIVKFRDELKLTDLQVDSILARSIALQKIKDAVRAKDPLQKYDSKPFENEALTAILSEEQYTKAIILNNNSNAIVEALQNWSSIEAAGLAQNYNKEETIKQFTAYSLARMCTSYRYSYDKAQQRLNMLQVDEKMPAALKALKAAQKYKNPTNGTQGNFQW